MILLGAIIALGAALAFAFLGGAVIGGLQHTLRTRFVERMRIMHVRRPIRWASVAYVIAVASLPTTLALLTAWQLIALVQRVLN